VTGDAEGPSLDRVEAVQAAWRRELPDVDVSSVAVVGRLLDVAHSVERIRAVALAAEGSDWATFDLLATLRRSGPPYRMSVGDLQRASLVTTGAVSQRVERAEQAGLVRRVPVPDDARKVAVELTVEGYRSAARLVRVVMAADRTLLENLDEAERAVLRDVLRSWGTALDRTTALGARSGGTEQGSGSGDRQATGSARPAS
jgi:DNA-binding MarR family transcriptional regulator